MSLSPKPAFAMVRELETKMVHIKPPPMLDQVTLCGMTDWLGTDHKGRPRGGEDVKRGPVTCQGCRWIANFCQAHKGLPDGR